MKSKRQNEIFQLLLSEHSLKTEDLAERFHVSLETIRRDIAVLSSNKMVTKVYGGIALSNDSRRITQMSSWEARIQQCNQEKIKIVSHALELIPDGSTVGLDIGTTAYELSRLFSRKKDLTVISNSLRIVSELAQNTEHAVYCVGGLMCRIETVSGGMAARDFLDNFAAIDYYMCSTDGLTLENGLTEFDEAVVDVKRRFIKIADRVIAMVDHSKFGKKALFPTCKLSDIDLLITDDGIAENDMEMLHNANINFDIV